MSLSSALVEDDWLKPLVEDLGLGGDEEDHLKWDDLAFLDLATPAHKSSRCNIANPSESIFGTECLFDGDYYLKEEGEASLELFPPSGDDPVPETPSLLDDLITQKQPSEEPSSKPEKEPSHWGTSKHSHQTHTMTYQRTPLPK
ncbi:Zinc finger X-linked protein ZXDA/ZXDB [Caligus rogercresseyi]|uniref:Zinc finger X-linked protein ZXDA/ZXDB n=1 Tax=Caligus rogercresseyi TaxID=217165 RepID=A0A7T8HLW0_CALRO|nr:Zinc finger X-linked protein ZXDA/ZXDB [Caligus rogercresseyi]